MNEGTHREEVTATAPPASVAAPRGPRLGVLAPIAVGVVALLVIGGLMGAFFGERLMRGAEQLSQWTAGGHDGHDHGDAGGDGGYYTCGMHPWVILPTAGLCPICHMDLTPLDPAKLAGELAIDPIVVQNIGVRVATVVEGPLAKVTRTVGTIGYDETGLRVCNTKVSGWIEDLLVDSEGATVSMGQPLFVIYSPELYAAQEEYLLAYRRRETAPQMVASARTRLRYFDVTDEQIAALEASGEPTRTMTIHSPHSGVVVEKVVNEGERVDAGMPVYRVADLSRVWVNVTLFEHQAPHVEAGQAARMTLPFLPGRAFEGTVAYVYPYLDAASRQIRVRLEFPNAEGRLKPGMFANVELESVLDTRATLVPREAVLRTGEREVAFVSLGEGRFEPRTIRTGVETQAGQLEVLEGLDPGERVVTSGQFLLDSESKMRIALAQMIAGEAASEQSAAAPAAADAEPEPMADGYPLSTCVVTGLALGAMGDPVEIEHEGRTVRFCCAACPPRFHANPGVYLEKLDAAEAAHRH